MPWCKFFIPKIASPHVKPDDPDFNDSVMYAKCIKGHVLRAADDWYLCENLPAPDAKCWQEGGDTIFSLQRRKRGDSMAEPNEPETSSAATPQSTRP